MQTQLSQLIFHLIRFLVLNQLSNVQYEGILIFHLVAYIWLLHFLYYLAYQEIYLQTQMLNHTQE